MSCRVFNRTLEEAVIFDFGTRARNLDCTKIVGRMTLLQKNKYCHGLFDRLGFVHELEGQSADDYVLDLTNSKLQEAKLIHVESHEYIDFISSVVASTADIDEIALSANDSIDTVSNGILSLP